MKTQAPTSLKGRVRPLIESRIEPTEPQNQIIARLREKWEGKQLTKRVIDDLNEKIPGKNIRIRQIAGMTEIDWGPYEGNGHGSLLVDHAIKNVMINCNELVEKNAAYFSALKDRNEARQRALAATKQIEDLETTMEQFLAAQAKLKTFLEYGCLFYEDCYAIRKELLGEK